MTVHPLPPPVKPSAPASARIFEFWRAVEQSGLSATQRHIALTVARHAGDGVCYASVQTIADACGLKKRQTQYGLKALRQAGWIVAVGRHASQAIMYRTAIPEGGCTTCTPERETSAYNAPGGAPHAPLGVHHMHGGGAPDAPNIPSTSPRTSPPLPSRERTRETTQPLADSSVDGMGGKVGQKEGVKTPPPAKVAKPRRRPHMPSPAAPGRLLESERGIDRMTIDELRELLRACEKPVRSELSKRIADAVDARWLIETYTRHELARAFQAASGEKVARPWVAFKGALEGTWRIAGEVTVRHQTAAEPRNPYANKPRITAADCMDTPEVKPFSPEIKDSLAFWKARLSGTTTAVAAGGAA